MKILFLAQRIPYPPDRGDRIRAFHIIQFLAQHHEIIVGTLAQSSEELEQVSGLREHTTAVDVEVVTRRQSLVQYSSAFLQRQPLTLAHYRSRRLAKCVARRLAACDMAFVYCSSMAPYIECSRLPKLIDFVDCDSAKWDDYAQRAGGIRRWIYRREGRMVRRYESQIVAQFDHCFVTTEQERALLAPHADASRVTPVGNGIDFAYFRRHPTALREPYTLLFTGVMDYFANVDGVTYFAQRVLPLIRRAIPQVTFLIVGRNPTAEVRELAQDPSITVTGYVPDVRPYLERAAVGVVPLRIARGIQNKLLEAMAMELPVVATSAAAEGIRAIASRHLLLADEAEAFAQSVVHLLRNEGLQREIGREARALVQQNYDWQATLRPVEKILAQVVERQSKPKERSCR